MKQKVLELQKICKAFSSVVVLEDVSLSIFEGEVCALMGENGAGKSTLCNITTGALLPDNGKIIVGGQTFSSLTISQSKQLKIAMVQQEVHVIPEMTVAENLFIGDEISRNGLVSKKQMEEETEELLTSLGFEISPKTPAKKLSVAGIQLLEIAKAIRRNAKIIILDEPTSALSQAEITILFDIIRRLKQQGIAFVYISHRMDEIFEICDRVAVLRDGKNAGERVVAETTTDEIIKLMVGRQYADFYDRKRSCFGEEVLRVEDLSGVDTGIHTDGFVPKKINFSLNKGEILGMSGLVGSGRTQIIRLLFGVDKRLSGKITIHGQPVSINGPSDAIAHSMAWLPEERKTQGVIVEASVRNNLTLSILDEYSKHLVIDDKGLSNITDEYIKKLNIKVRDPKQQMRTLSGGNQQKVVIAKWLAKNPNILVLDEPTRGIDIGAKVEIYRLLNELTDQGISIILISSELPEVMGMSDRILVMYEGALTAILEKDEFSEERIMSYAAGGKRKDD